MKIVVKCPELRLGIRRAEAQNPSSVMQRFIGIHINTGYSWCLKVRSARYRCAQRDVVPVTMPTLMLTPDLIILITANPQGHNRHRYAVGVMVM